MAVRSINVKLQAEVGNYVQGLQRARAATGDLINELSKSEQQRQNMQRLGAGMFVAGAGIAAGIGLATKAAIDWETAWAGVVKTVDGSDEQLASLEEELREIARTLPATHAEIAGVAEAAGQLGVATDDIADFTRTMVQLGTATNLTAQDAAVALAQFSNVMGTAPEDVERLGAALVDLGNNSATTEADIVAMAQRIGGAGSTIGLAESDVLGFSAALASVGIRAEAGGSAISRAMIDIETAVRSGGDQLNTLAQVAGMSADEFTQAYQQDAAGAIATFVAGLGRMEASGEDVFAVLDQLGFSEIRLRDALLRLAASGDLLNRSLDTGAQAWDENLALTEEAERRYGTTAAQLSIARNQLNDFAIDMGKTFLPVVGDAANTVGHLLDVLSDLPAPLKTAAGVLAAAAAGTTLLGGALLLLVPRIAATKAALDQLAASGGRAAASAAALRGATAFMLGPWGLAIAAAVGLATAAFSAWSVSQAQARAEAQEVADTLDEVTGAFTDATRALVAHKLEEQGALEAAQRLGLNLAELTDIVMAEGDSVETLINRLNELGAVSIETDGNLLRIKGSTQAHAEAAGTALDAVGALSGELDAGVAAWQRTSEAEGDALDATRRLDPATRDLADSFGVAAGAAGDVSDAVEDLDEELEQLFDRVFGLQVAEDDLADAFDNLTEQIQKQRDAGVEGAGSFRGMTEAARENRDAAREVLEAYGALALETIRSTGSQEEAAGAAAAFEAKLDELEKQTGINVRELEGYNDAAAEIERLIEVTFSTEGVERSIAFAETMKRRLDQIDRTVRISFETTGAAPVGSIAIAERHGGIVAAQHGLITSSPTVLFGERGTGLEAFIPREGISSARGLELADTAARWHGGRVVASDGSSLGGPFQWHGARSAADGGGATSGGAFTGELYLDSGELLGIVRGEIRQSQTSHDRELRRRFNQGVGAAS